MADIIPFRATRPTPDKASLVTTLAYDEYSATELASWLDFNPFSFLHIINPAYVNQQKIGVEQRFRIVAAKYKDFKRDRIFIQDENPAYYLYRIATRNYSFIGIMAGTSIEDYKSQLIKKHENTLDYRVLALRDYFKISGFNTEPVLMMHPDNPDLDKWIENYQNNTPIYDFTTTNKQKHTVWKVDNQTDIDYITQIFKGFEHLYIADGHHRSAASEMIHDENTENPLLRYFMSYLVSEKSIRINEYNRVIHDLNGHTTEEFLNLLEKDFILKPRKQQLWKPSQKFEFGMYLNNVYYSLKLKNLPEANEGLEVLDAQILYDKILHKILGIGDLRTDSRIDYIPGNQSVIEMFKKIDNGEYEVGFTLFPPSIDEIKYLAHNNLTMPPKSTYIEPKLRNGLMIYEF